MSRDGWAALLRGATGLSAVCDCGISWSYSLTIFKEEPIAINRDGFLYFFLFWRVTALRLIWLCSVDFGIMLASPRENLSSGVPTKWDSNQSAQLQIENPLVASLNMTLSNKRKTKALIRLRWCAGWSAPLLFANLRRQVFSRRGPCKGCHTGII